MDAFSIRHYLTPSGSDPFSSWLKGLRDPVGKVQVAKRVNRLEFGNFGDHKYCRDGVWELRIDLGPGYRVYFSKTGIREVLLLGGGNKHGQKDDIDKAASYWQDWQSRGHGER